MIANLSLALGILFCLSNFSNAVIALVLGVLVAILVGNPYANQTKLLSQRLLSLSIIGLGASMNLIEVGKVGLNGLAITTLSIALTLTAGIFLGRLFKIDREIYTLISVGTAICGGSAIASVAPVIRAKANTITISLGTVFLLNALALFIFPSIGHFFSLTQAQFGLWSALAIHDTSSVVGAGAQYGAEALKIGTTVKLARALWIVPVTVGFGFTQKNKETDLSKAKKPWFILGFLLMAAIFTWIPQLEILAAPISWIAKKGFILTLFFIGLGLTKDSLNTVGLKPFLHGLTLWILVSICSLLIIKM